MNFKATVSSGFSHALPTVLIIHKIFYMYTVSGSIAVMCSSTSWSMQIAFWYRQCDNYNRKYRTCRRCNK